MLQVRYTDFIREYNYSYFLSPCHNIVNTFEGLHSTKEFYFFAQEYCATASLREAVYDTGGWGFYRFCFTVSYSNLGNRCSQASLRRS